MWLLASRTPMIRQTHASPSPPCRIQLKSNNVDFSLQRPFPVTERLTPELRGDSFNTSKFANFDIPEHTIGNASFAIVNTARPAVTVRLVLPVIL